MAPVFVLDGALDVLSSGHVLDLDARAFILVALHREVHIDTQLTVLDLSSRDTKCPQELLQLPDDKLSIVGVSRLCCGDNLEKGHASSIVVDEDLVALVNALGSVLLHLDALHKDMALVLPVVIEEETTILHDWVMLLRDLVGLGQVSIDVVLPVELDFGKDSSTEGQRRRYCEVEALLVEDGEHAWETQVDEVGVSVGFLARGVL